MVVPLYFLDNLGNKRLLPERYEVLGGQIFDIQRVTIYLIRHSGLFGSKKIFIPLCVGNHVWMYPNYHEQIYLGQADGKYIFADLEIPECVSAYGMDDLQRMFDDYQLRNPNEIEL